MPLLHRDPTTTAKLLPGYGGSKSSALLDGALTAGFDQTRPMLIGIDWVLLLATAVAVSYQRGHSTRARLHHQHPSTIDSERTTS